MARRTQEQWIQEYQRRKAFWVHDGNPQRPHALLTSGSHSNGYFNSELVMEDPRFVSDMAGSLVSNAIGAGLDIMNVDRVAGPAMGAVILAHDVAAWVGVLSGRPCFRAYAEKESEGAGKKMVFKRTRVLPGERVLVVEDVLTTGESAVRVMEAIFDAKAILLPWCLVLVNRSGGRFAGNLPVVSLISRHMPIWSPSECPLCKAGSEPLRPKETQNWERLTRDYRQEVLPL